MATEEDWDGVYVHMGVACEQSASSAEVACGKHLSTYMGPHGRPGSMESEVGYSWEHESVTCESCWRWIYANVKRCQTCRAFCGGDECENCLPRCICGAILWNLDGGTKVNERHTEHCQKLIDMGYYPRILNKGVFRDEEHEEAFGTRAFTRDWIGHWVKVNGATLDVGNWLAVVPERYRRIAVTGLRVIYRDVLDRQPVRRGLHELAVDSLSRWYSKHLWPDPWGDIYEGAEE